MSLFTETALRAQKAEMALEEAQKEIAKLNAELNRKMTANNALKKVDARYNSARSSCDAKPARYIHLADNELSDAEIELMMGKFERARMAEQVDASDLKSEAKNGVSVRSRLLAPIALLLRMAK